MERNNNEPTVANDGAIVAVLLVMMLALAAEMLMAIGLYATHQTRVARLTLISGWSNVANAIVHLWLVITLYSDTDRFLQAGIADADNLVGPLVLMGIHMALGLRTLCTESAGPAFPFGWNLFVAISGSLVPIVWPEFMDVGLSRWPYLIVVLWFGIFAFEGLAALPCSPLVRGMDSGILMMKRKTKRRRHSELVS